MTQVSLVASRLSGPAPLAVHFDATGTVDNAVGNAFKDLRYDFNFGDTAAGTWGTSGLSKNTEQGGPVAAHIYDTPGTYKATLRAGDGAETQTITVLDPDAVWEGANTVCLSTGGSFTGAPVGAVLVTVSSWPQFESGKRYLLKRGDNFSSLGMVKFGQLDGTRLGAFGQGSRPITAKIELQAVSNNYPQAQDAWIKNVDVIGIEPSEIFHNLTGRNILLYQNKINTTAEVLGSIRIANGMPQRMRNYSNFYTPHNIFVVDNENHDLGFGSNTGEGQLIWMGNQFWGGASHSVRLWQSFKSFVAHNHLLGRPQLRLGKANLKMHSRGSNRISDVMDTLGSSYGSASSFNVVSHNVFNSTDSTGIWNTLSMKPQDATNIELVEWSIAEYNTHVKGADNTIAGAFAGSELTMRGSIRENGIGRPAVGHKEASLVAAGVALPAPQGYNMGNSPSYADEPLPLAPDGSVPPIDPPITCPEGYELIDGVCVEIPPIEPPITCPEGYELIDGECVEIPPIDPPTEPCTCVDGAQGVQGIQGVQGVQGLPGADGNDAEMDPLMDEALDFYDYIKAYFTQ